MKSDQHTGARLRPRPAGPENRGAHGREHKPPSETLGARNEAAAAEIQCNATRRTSWSAHAARRQPATVQGRWLTSAPPPVLICLPPKGLWRAGGERPPGGVADTHRLMLRTQMAPLAISG